MERSARGGSAVLRGESGEHWQPPVGGATARSVDGARGVEAGKHKENACLRRKTPPCFSVFFLSFAKHELGIDMADLGDGDVLEMALLSLDTVSVVVRT